MTLLEIIEAARIEFTSRVGTTNDTDALIGELTHKHTPSDVRLMIQVAASDLTLWWDVSENGSSSLKDVFHDIVERRIEEELLDLVGLFADPDEEGEEE